MSPTGNSRRDFLKTIGLSSAAVTAPGLLQATEMFKEKAQPAVSIQNGERPNIVIIMTDQHQARCSAREGYPLDTTPYMDELANQGVWFNKAYTSSPLCVPARASLFTGRYPNATGIRDNTMIRIKAKYQKDLLDVVKDQGYATALIGKNHSYLEEERFDYCNPFMHEGGLGNNKTEEEKAFDKWLGELCHGVYEKPTPFPVELQPPFRLVGDAGKWIGKVKSSNPFFLWLSIAEPHNPYQVPEPYFSMFPPGELPPVLADKSALETKGFKWQFTSHLEREAVERYDEQIPRQRSNYYGMLRLIDDQLKRFTEILDREGVRNNTLIFFISDHGDFAGEYGLIRKGPELPEALVRVPFFAVGPGISPHSGPHPAHVSTVDLMPTICEAIGVLLPDGVQGRSLWALLSGREYPEKEFASAYAETGYGGLNYNWDDNPDFSKALNPRIIFNCINQYSQSGIMRMIRKDEWKLVFDMQGNGQLYNLEKDPAEIINLYGNSDYIEVQGKLVGDLLAWTLRTQDPLPFPGGNYERKSHPRNYWTAED